MVKRVSKVRVFLSDQNDQVTARLEFRLDGLSKDEVENVIDTMTDRVVDALRHVPYFGTTPFRNVAVE